MDVLIRIERSGDADAIEAVTIAAFLDAPHTSHTEQRIVAKLRAAGQMTVSLVAEIDGNIVGHVAVSPVSISDGAAGWFGLGPVSVVPSHQRRGIGSQLIREAMSHLRAWGAAGCVVLGEPDYYGRFGFRAESRLVLSGVPPEYFQAISLNGSQPTGTVSYDAAFNE